MADNVYSVGQVVNPASGERIVQSVWSPTYGWLNLTNLGGIYTGGGGSRSISELDNGGSYLGYAGSQSDPATEVAIHGRFSSGGLTVNADGTYSLRNELGETYSFGAPAAAPTAPAPMTPPPGVTQEQKSAKAMIESTLSQYGLQGLADRLWGDYVNGVPIEQVFVNLRQTDEYKQRFRGMEALSAKGRAISEAEYIGLERSYTQIMRSFGLPSGFYDSPDDFATLIAGEVSPSEVADRVQLAATYAFQSPPEVRAEMNRLYGWGVGEITALVLDPNKALPLLQQQYIAGQTSAAATRTGFGALTQNEAERLAQRGLTAADAERGFSTLVESRELFTPLEQGEDTISRQEQIGAAFEGNTAARQRIQKRARERVARFEGGGQFASGRQGFSGVGEAS